MKGFDPVEAALETARAGCSCSEAVMAGFGPLYGLPADTGVKIACGFAGGMGIENGVCGAVAAGVMVLGLAFGPEGRTDMEGRATVRAMTRIAVEEYLRRMTVLRGSIFCVDLSGGVDLRDPASALELRRSGRPEAVIRDAAEILRSVLADAPDLWIP